MSGATDASATLVASELLHDQAARHVSPNPTFRRFWNTIISPQNKSPARGTLVGSDGGHNVDVIDAGAIRRELFRVGRGKGLRGDSKHEVLCEVAVVDLSIHGAKCRVIVLLARAGLVTSTVPGLDVVAFGVEPDFQELSIIRECDVERAGGVHRDVGPLIVGVRSIVSKRCREL